MAIKTQKKINWLLEYALYRAVETCFYAMPVSLCYKLGEKLGSIAYRLVHKRRRTVQRNLHIAYGAVKTPCEIEQLAKRVFQTTTGNLLASIKTATMSKAQIRACIEIEGAEEIVPFIKKNKGAILLLPHMGNWEACAHLNSIVYKGVATAAMYRPLNNPYLDRLVKKRREASGSQLIARKDGINTALKQLREGGILGILADQRVGSAGQVTPFFGRLTAFSPLPYLLKKRTNCGVLALSVTTKAPGRWKIRYQQIATCDTEVNTGDVALAMENAMRQSPADCFWLQDRWKMEEKLLKITGKLPLTLPRHLESKHPTYHPFILGMYLEKNELKNALKLQPSLEKLSKHRPDARLQLYSENPDEWQKKLQNLANINIQKSPKLETITDVYSFLEQKNQQDYIDLFILPETLKTLVKSDTKAKEKPLTSLLFLNYNQIDQSLKENGLSEQEIELMTSNKKKK